MRWPTDSLKTYIMPLLYYDYNAKTTWISTVNYFRKWPFFVIFNEFNHVTFLEPQFVNSGAQTFSIEKYNF